MAYLHNDKEQFAEAINLTVYKSGLPEEVVEKDYYVTVSFPIVVLPVTNYIGE